MHVVLYWHLSVCVALRCGGIKISRFELCAHHSWKEQWMPTKCGSAHPHHWQVRIRTWAHLETPKHISVGQEHCVPLLHKTIAVRAPVTQDHSRFDPIKLPALASLFQDHINLAPCSLPNSRCWTKSSQKEGAGKTGQLPAGNGLQLSVPRDLPCFRFGSDKNYSQWVVVRIFLWIRRLWCCRRDPLRSCLSLHTARASGTEDLVGAEPQPRRSDTRSRPRADSHSWKQQIALVTRRTWPRSESVSFIGSWPWKARKTCT